MRKLHVITSALLVVFCLAGKASADLSIYSDELDNNWQNWSWSNTTNWSCTSPVYAGSYSVSTSLTAWGGFYLHHDAFNASDFTAVQFYINGGSGGQSLQFSATLSGRGQHPVTLPIQANTWVRIKLSLSALGVGNNPNFDGIQIYDVSGKGASTFYIDSLSLIASAPPNPIGLSVDFTKPVQTVDPKMFGVNTASWDIDLDSATTSQYLGAAGIDFLRFPGGSESDDYNWQTNSTSAGVSNTNFDQFASIAVPLHAQVILTTNYGSGTAAEAANWVEYSNVTHKYGFHYWEIGNECYGSWEKDTHAVQQDPYTYAQQVAAYMKAMKTNDPTIKVGAVSVVSEDSYANNTNHPAKNPVTGVTHNGWTPVMLATFAQEGVYPDFIIYHYYMQNPNQESDYFLLHGQAHWQTDIANLRMMLNDYLGTAVGSKIQIFVTECNSVDTNPGKQSVSLVNALFMADSLGSALQTEAHGMLWWDLRNGQQETGENNSPALYGWRNYGDYGIVSNTNERYPTYYAFRVLLEFARSGATIYEATSSYDQLSVYAAKNINGKASIMVINKSPDTAAVGKFALTGFSPSSAATIYSYGIPQDNAERTGVGSPDMANTTTNGASSAMEYTFAPYSITVFVFSAS